MTISMDDKVAAIVGIPSSEYMDTSGRGRTYHLLIRASL
jgi:hypothetical protein